MGCVWDCDWDWDWDWVWWEVEAENGSKNVDVESSFGFVVTIGVRSNDYCLSNQPFLF